VDVAFINVSTGCAAARVSTIACARKRADRVGACRLNMTVVYMHGALINVGAAHPAARPARVARARERSVCIGAASLYVAVAKC
jgi:hypothetical protein